MRILIKATGQTLAGPTRFGFDPSAFILARDHGLPIRVFDSTRKGAILRGEPIGTLVRAKGWFPSVWGV